VPTLDINIVYLVAVVIVGVLGGAIGLKLASRMGSEMERGQLNETVGFLEKELKKAKGTIGEQKRGISLPEGTEITEDTMDGTIKSLITRYASMAPKKYQFLLQDPAIVNFLIAEAKKNPKQAKEVLSHFIGGDLHANKGSGSSESEQQLETISQEGA